MASTKVEIGEDLYDVANRVYGHPLGVHWLIEDNNLSGINASVSHGIFLEIRDAKVEIVPIAAIEFKEQKQPDYLINEHQSIFDVAIEKHGDIEGVFRFVEQNGYDGITEYLWANRPIKVENKAINKRYKLLLADYMPIATIDENEKSDGIGFMYVEINFLVR